MGLLLDYLKKNASAGGITLAIIIVIGFLQVISYLGAPIPRPAWSSDVDEVKEYIIEVGSSFFQDRITRQEDRILELRLKKDTFPQTQRPYIEELIRNRQKLLKEDQRRYRKYTPK